MVNVNIDVEDPLVVTKKFEDTEDDVYNRGKLSMAAIERGRIIVPLI